MNLRQVFIMIYVMLCSLLQAQNLSGLRMDAFGNLWAGNSQQAIADFSSYLERSNSPSGDIFLGRGKAYLITRDYDKALSDFRMASDHGNIEAALWMARSFALSGKPNEAVTAIEKFLKSSRYPDIRSIKKDTCFKVLYPGEEWFMLWQNDWNFEEEDIYREASFYAERSNFSRAHSLIEERLRSGLADDRLHYYNSLIYFREENTGLALSEINHALSLQSDNVLYLKQKATYLMEMEERREAFRILSGILEQVPEDFDTRYERISLALETGEPAIAGKDLDLMLKYSQKPALVFLAGKVAYASEDYISALQYFNSLLEKDQSRADYFKARGMTYYNTRMFKQAGYDLSMSLDLQPDDPEVNYYKGLTENAMGEKSMACYYMERAMKKGYSAAREYFNKNCR